MTSEGRDSLPALTSLRFFAAFAVLVLHYRDMLGPLPPWLLQAIIGGQYGVTFFFVLSGFILTYRYDDWFRDGVADRSYWRFMRLRLARIYPIYVLGLLLDTPWHVVERAQAGQLAAAGTTYWAAWLLNLVGLQAWVPAVPFAMYWNTPAWSVSAEFFFYATFPFLSAWLARRLRTPRAVALMLAAVVLGGVGLYAAVLSAMNFATRVGSEAQYIVQVYNPLLRYSEFFAGCLAGRWFLGAGAVRLQLARPDAAGVRLRNTIVVLSLVAIAARIGMPEYRGPSAAWWLLDVSIKYGFFILPFAAIILALAAGRSWLSAWLERPWLVLLGEASYALYIIHWSLTSFLRMGYLGTPVSVPTALCAMAATVAASVLCYRFVEVPWRRRWRGESQRGEAGPGTLEPTGR